MKDMRLQLDKALQYAVESNYALYDQVINKRRELKIIRYVFLAQGNFFMMATMIKMDIEGYEWRTLQGGAEIIRDYEPKLVVCLYHILEDLWRIPLYVRELVPKYKLYLRHHSPSVWDSVLYAVL